MRLRATRLTAVAHAARIAVGASPAWSPDTAWFSAGEQGVWYDPTDLSTMFQDSAGTTPVTAVEQPVGLILDRRLGATPGPELVANGDFSAGATGWTLNAAASVSGGAVVFDGVTSLAPGTDLVTQSTVVPTQGRRYEVTYTITSSTTANIGVYFGGVNLTARSAAGTYTERMLATLGGATYKFAIVSRSTTAVRTGGVDNISVREVPGNHAFQATSTARPTLRNRYNLLTNGALVGAVAGTPGAAPTGWSMFGTGGATTSVTALGDGNNSITYSATAARQFINFAVTVAANNTYKAKISATLVSGTLDLVELINASVSPAGTTITYALNGATVAGSTNLTGTSEIELTIAVAGTAGTSNLRLGVGCTTNRTASVTISRVSFVTAADAGLDYQRTASATDYDSDATKFYAPLSFDGSDDSLAATDGGGGTTGGTWVFGIRLGALGAARTIWSDAGTNTGYRLRVNASNQVVFEAGNGTAYTSATVSTALTLGQRCVITAWHDGATLNVQVDNGTVATASMGTVTAGTAGITIGKANGAASEYFLGYLYGGIYVRNIAKTSDLASAKAWMAAKAGVTL